MQGITTQETHGVQNLLDGYRKRADISSRAHQHASRTYTRAFKALTLGSIVLGTLATSLTGEDVSSVASDGQCGTSTERTFVMFGITATVALLAALTRAFDPSKKAAEFSQAATEFGDIVFDIDQFVQESRKTHDQYRSFSMLMLQRIKIWEAAAPSYAERHLRRAQRESRADIEERAGIRIGVPPPLSPVSNFGCFQRSKSSSVKANNSSSSRSTGARDHYSWPAEVNSNVVPTPEALRMAGALVGRPIHTSVSDTSIPSQPSINRARSEQKSDSPPSGPEVQASPTTPPNLPSMAGLALTNL